MSGINDFVVKFATVNGSGSASANGIFAKTLFRMGIPFPVLSLASLGVEAYGRMRGKPKMLTREKVAMLKEASGVTEVVPGVQRSRLEDLFKRMVLKKREQERAGGAVADAVGERGEARADQIVARDDGPKQVRGFAAVCVHVALVAQAREQRQDRVVGQVTPALAERGGHGANRGRTVGPQHLEHFQFRVTDRRPLRHGPFSYNL